VLDTQEQPLGTSNYVEEAAEGDTQGGEDSEIGFRTEEPDWGEHENGHQSASEYHGGMEEIQEEAGAEGDGSAQRGGVHWGAQWEEGEGTEEHVDSAPYQGFEDNCDPVEPQTERFSNDGEARNGRSQFRDSQQWGDETSFQSRGVGLSPAPSPPPAQRWPEGSTGHILQNERQFEVPGRADRGRGKAAANAGSVPRDSPGVSALVKSIFQGEGKRQGPQKGGKRNSAPDLAGELWSAVWILSIRIVR
jgi:hypothetical protein